MTQGFPLFKTHAPEALRLQDGERLRLGDRTKGLVFKVKKTKSRNIGEKRSNKVEVTVYLDRDYMDETKEGDTEVVLEVDAYILPSLVFYEILPARLVRWRQSWKAAPP
jgi:hypothetical protein